jgi:glycerophosphoryl diester phosphodiesterase
MQQRKVRVHAHRGAPTQFPENSITGFQYAIALGVDAIEMDLILASDGSVRISHDFYDGALPSLEEALELAPLGPFSFDLEIKCYPQCGPPERLVARVLERVRTFRLEERVTLLSFDFRALAAAREMAPGLRIAALMDHPNPTFRTLAADRVSPKWTLVTPEWAAAAHAAGMQVIPWTANTPKQWERLVQAGVDGILTDDPAALIAWLARSPGRF